MKIRNQTPSRIKAIALLGLIIWVVTTASLPPTIQNTTNSRGLQLASETNYHKPINPQTVGEFFDTAIPRQLETRHIPGAAIALVKDGQLLFSRGYGYANLENAQKVDAESTSFRTGSVAKLFVWTSVLQLSEQGKLDLNVDVNQYLNEFQIPDTFPEPITLRHLMTHTAGFEDGPVGMMRRSVNELEPLREFLPHRIPARVFQPGQVTAYSNYGTALAGHIVEIVSGLPFEDYVEKNILNPLGMTHTTFHQPLPDMIAGQAAQGYVFSGNNFQKQPFEVIQIAPAGGASATVNDMAKFMRMHLSGGSLNGVSVLREKTVQEMQRAHFYNDPRLTGVAYGFYQLRINDQVLLTHAGDTAYFRSQMFLKPEDNLGFYIVYNAPGGAAARMELAQAFFDRFFPVNESVNRQSEYVAEPGSTTRYSGKYISSRSNQTTIEKIRMLVEPMYMPISVDAASDGTLAITEPVKLNQSPGTYLPGRWKMLSPGFFQKSDGSDRLVIRTDKSASAMLFFDSNPLRGYRKLSDVEEMFFNPLFPLIMVVLSIGSVVQIMFNKKAHPETRWLICGQGLMPVLILIGFTAFGLFGFADYLFGQISLIWHGVFFLPVLYAGLTCGLIIRVLRQKDLWRISYLAVLISASSLIGWMAYWNLIGWNY